MVRVLEGVEVEFHSSADARLADVLDGHAIDLEAPSVMDAEHDLFGFQDE